MLLGRIRDFLLPGAAEGDPGFRRQVVQFSVSGLRILGGLEIAVPALWLFTARMLGGGVDASRVWQGVFIVSVGAATIVLSIPKWANRWARVAAASSAWVVGIALVAEPIRPYLAGQIALLMLVTVAAVPFRPFHTMVLGLAIAAPAVFLAGMNPSLPLFLLLVALASTGLTALIYSQRSAAYRSQSTAQVYERAASLGKLAAAVSHELSSPIGVLTSSIDTLLVLAARQATTPPGEQQKMVAIQAELRRTVADSAKRLQKLVARMQGLTNLEEAGVEAADINDLVREVVTQYEPEIRGGIRIEVDLEPLPALTCRPRQLMAVLSTLVSNAIHAVNSRGRILISTRDEGSEIEIRVQDNGRGVPASELQTIFDPDFMEKSGRISTRNWSLFSARQIVLEHGGEIRIGSEQGRGTTVTVSLPTTIG